MKRGSSIKLREKKECKRKGSRSTIQKSSKICGSCGSIDIVQDKNEGNLTCRGCGTVISINLLDYSHIPGNESIQTNNELLGSIGLGKTGIQQNSSSTQLNAQQRRNQNLLEKNLQRGFQEIKELSEKLNLPRKSVTKAQEIYKELWEKKINVQGKNKSIAVACIFTSCRIENNQRVTPKECSILSGRPISELSKTYKYILNKLPDIKSQINEARGNGSAGISRLAVRFCSYLRLSSEISVAIQSTCEKIEELSKNGYLLDFQGKHSDSVVAGAIFFVTQLSNEKREVSLLSNVIGASPSTIRNMNKLMISHKEKILPPKFLQSLKK